VPKRLSRVSVSGKSNGVSKTRRPSYSAPF